MNDSRRTGLMNMIIKLIFLYIIDLKRALTLVDTLYLKS